MKIKLLSRITEGAFRYQAWPTVCRGDDGTLFVGTSGHRLNHICPFGKNLMYKSVDDGETWTAPQIINDTWLDDRDAGMLSWGDSLLLTWFNHAPATFDTWDVTEKDKRHYSGTDPLSMGMRKMWETLPKEELPYGSFTKISRDGGKTWSSPRPAPVTSPHGPCRLSDGTLIYVGSHVENGEYEVASERERIRAWKSCDDGETWEFLSILPVPADFDAVAVEPHAVVLPDGEILAAVRRQPKTKPVMKNLGIYLTRSADGGRTWSEAKMLSLCGAPPHLFLHSSGAVILSYSRRAEPMGQYVRVSRDNGLTWSKDLLVSPLAPDWDHGYPSTTELSDGELLTVYYEKWEGDPFNSLLCTRWNLDEIPE